MAITTKSICNGKALIVWSDALVELKSYDTTMARAKSLGGGAYKLLMLSTVESHYSTTTCRHVNEFMRELGLPVLNKQKYLQKGAELYAEEQNAFANNGYVEVFGLSVSPDRKLKTDRTITIKWGN